ncbi:hypothetical protein GCM10027170_04550 [Aliiglaciecola aliphaticivorans]
MSIAIFKPEFKSILDFTSGFNIVVQFVDWNELRLFSSTLLAGFSHCLTNAN